MHSYFKNIVLEPISTNYTELYDKRYEEIENGENALNQHLTQGKISINCLRCGGNIIIEPSITSKHANKLFTSKAFYNVRCEKEDCFQLSVRKKDANESDYKLVVTEVKE